MYPRTEYEMTEQDLKEIIEASKATPVMYITGGTPIGGNQQANANRAWGKLGEKMGFDAMTVRPINEKGHLFFSAIPSETETQKKDREKKEAEQKKANRIKELKEEIAEREKEKRLLEEESGGGG